MKAIVVNCSYRQDGSPCYNLGAHKLHDWLSAQEREVQFVNSRQGIADLLSLWSPQADLLCLSVIFSWNAPLARSIAMRMKNEAEIWCGGPGMFAPSMALWWRKETGCEAVRGLDDRFERQRGNYQMCFASRGCPVRCSWCIVSPLEGSSFSYDPEFIPAPVLCDNNLSALPADYQEHIIRRYVEFGQPLVEANSGFEPRYFDRGTYLRWKPLFDQVVKGRKAYPSVWRFAFDEMREEADVQRMMTILEQERPRRKQVYCLIGNEPISVCYERCRKVIDWGGEPFCQYVLPLNWMGDPRKVKVRFDWASYRRGRDFCRYFNRHYWRKLHIWQYRPRQGEPPPFAALEPRVVI